LNAGLGFPCLARSTYFFEKSRNQVLLLHEGGVHFGWFYDLTDGTINKIMSKCAVTACRELELGLDFILKSQLEYFHFAASGCVFLQFCELVGLTIIHKKTRGERERGNRISFATMLYFGDMLEPIHSLHLGISNFVFCQMANWVSFSSPQKNLWNSSPLLPSGQNLTQK
jgi:hypothetical protein